MLAATVNVLEKVAPKAVAALGKAGVLEVAGLAGIVAEGLNLGITYGGKALNNIVEPRIEAKKQELLEKRAAAVERKAQALAQPAAEQVVVQEVEAEVVEEKPKTSKKKK